MCDLQSLQKPLQDIENEYLDTNSELDGVYNAAAPTLLNMPVEIILKICSFLDAYFIKNTLSKVCTRFAEILSDTAIWRFWVQSKMDGCYPTLPYLKIWKEVEIDWEQVCVEIDSEEKKWNNVKDTVRHIVIKDVHYASVDTVLLVNNGDICISGGRDRGMALWKIVDIQPHDQCDNTTTFIDAKPRHNRINAHSGWVWDLAADNINDATKIYSASWDNTVKAWDLETFTDIQVFHCGISTLSIAARENLIMAGLYSKKVFLFDVRVGPNHIKSYKPHRGPVLALDAFENRLASVSEDRTLAVYDFVAGKLLTSDVHMPTDIAYPVCISWSSHAMFIGDSKGCLHVIHPQEHFYIRTHNIWRLPETIRSGKITGCYHKDGNLILCSDKGDIKFYYNGNPPKEYASVKTTTIDATQLRYQNGVLCIGTCDSALEFWVPNERYSDL